MTAQISHMVHMAPLSCLMTRIWYIQCNGIQDGATWLPHGSDVDHPAAPGHHPPPIWHPMVPRWGTWLQYGSHLVLNMHIWFTSPIWLSYSACTMAPMWHLQLPYGACISHMVHTAPIEHTWLPYRAHSSHVAITWHMQLPYGAMCLPHGAIYLQYGTHSSHPAHSASIWPLYVTFCPQMMPSSSQMPYLLPYGVCAPIQHTWLQYGVIH
jgi:hypothetical protein